jgi:inosine-uridine nucleoside N-ribohydrolase
MANSLGREVPISPILTPAFNPENLTAEAEGADPSGPNVTRTNPAALREGMPTTLPLQGIDAATFMVDMVRQYPGQVEIYAAGAMTNVALAIKLDSTFAQNVKSIVIQGGYLDVNVLQATVAMDIWSDFNLFFDPEAASIMFEAPFPEITVVG